ncbi:hypothetical protein E4N62_45375 [Streptomyces sp. MNU76]|uniref:hypothetical protein n=1 Tax=Streptomyces sp. MNU76 TaxID=2560026 RepID=UPI001E418ECB|nr:hypothetical protein [Streptomyces sp. MNU76]MCC9711817.1 hypothetical protein [Streptomyces sp. MNU76]
MVRPRGPATRERRTGAPRPDRLDRTAGELESATSSGLAEAERARVRHEAGWQARIETLLENLADAERSQAAEELQALLAQHTSQGGVSADRGGLAVDGNVDIRAEGGSIAAGVVHGGARIGPPPAPGPSRG